MSRFADALEDGVDMVFTIGTSAFSLHCRTGGLGARAGIPTVEINPVETRLTRSVDHHLPLGRRGDDGNHGSLDRHGLQGVPRF